jgi:predicted transcriptional regulator YheO
LGQTFGQHCEIVVHDFEAPEHSIIAIANGGLTGRKIGDTLDALGLQLLKNRRASDIINYTAKTKDGRELRSSSIFLRDETDQIFGALCINLDISGLLKFQEWLQETLGGERPSVNERFEHTVDGVLDSMFQSAIYSIGKDIADLKREDKVAVVANLESKGAFLIRYSVERIAELLGMTKYTIYNYLDEIRAKHKTAEAVQVEGFPIADTKAPWGSENTDGK